MIKGRAYASAERGYGRRPLALVAARSLAPVVRVDRPLVRRVGAEQTRFYPAVSPPRGCDLSSRGVPGTAGVGMTNSGVRIRKWSGPASLVSRSKCTPRRR